LIERISYLENSDHLGLWKEGPEPVRGKVYVFAFAHDDLQQVGIIIELAYRAMIPAVNKFFGSQWEFDECSCRRLCVEWCGLLNVEQMRMGGLISIIHGVEEIGKKSFD
jgi:hypothetical protein